MTGSIMRGIGSFYTVLCDEDGQEYTLRAQKKLRHQKLTPMVGDRVRFSPGEGEVVTSQVAGNFPVVKLNQTKVLKML